MDKIILGNSIEVLQGFEDNTFDLTVTSPPYDNLRTYNGKIKDEVVFEDGFSFPFVEMARELYRVTKKGGVVVWVVNDQVKNGGETGSSFKQALKFMEIGFKLHDTMIYEKNTSSFPARRDGNRYTQIFEYMFVFSKGVVKTHNPLMIDCLHAGLELNGTTYKNYSKNDQIRKKMANPVKNQKIKGNIWDYVVGKNKEDQEAKGHPAPFPCKLAEDHILSWTNEGDLVVDPMCGSGTTCKVAQAQNRRFIGIDISEEYCAIARSRLIGKATPQKTLFVTQEMVEPVCA